MKARSRIIYCAAAGFIAWTGLISQAYFSFSYFYEHGLTTFDGMQRYLCYYSILSNILAAVIYMMQLVRIFQPQSSFALSPSLAGCVTVSLVFVGLVFAALLQHLRVLTAWPMVAALILHYITPALFVLYWLVFVSKRQRRWGDVVRWVAFPFAYLIYTYAQGARTGLYPYPFIDVVRIGYAHALRNSAILLVLFAIGSALLILLDRHWPFSLASSPRDEI